MFLDSFDEIGSMPGAYSITLNPNIPPMQNGKCRVPIETKEEVEAQLKEMTTQDIITPQVQPTP